MSNGKLFTKKCLGEFRGGGGDFQRWGYCPEGNYLEVIGQGNCLAGNFMVGNYPGGSCPGRNYLGVIARGAKV